MDALKDLKLMAQGGQAQIYHYGESKVLRVLRKPDDAALLDNEIRVMRALKNRVDVPDVYESMIIEGKPAVVVEKINGFSMLDYIKRRPFKLSEQAALLANLHANMPDNIDISDLGMSKVRSRYLIGLADLSDEDKAFVFKVLDELPEGTALCHGDFHPGNIMKSGDKNYIIDWFGAYKGDLVSDVAHTYLLLKNVPKFSGINGIQYRIMKASGTLIARTYLKAFHNIRPFDWAVLSKWLLIKAAERAFYGWDGEKPLLYWFIDLCKKNPTQPQNWYKML